ncbi:MAG TPA: hypothetical protein VFX58_04665 [Chitinophagaceae bacterium]|nr:hypothetical protein [Chitinophagaceae bacterium]
MESMNLNKQKMYSLIVAGVALVALLLPWVTVPFFGSLNGFRSWGILSFIGVVGVAIAVFMGNKSLAFDDTSRKIAMGSFAAIALGALIFVASSKGFGSGVGLWLCLVSGLAGLAFILGFIKLPDDKKPPVS